MKPRVNSIGTESDNDVPLLMCCTLTATKIKPRPACECLKVVQQCRTTLESGTASAAPAAPSTPALVHVCVRVYVCASVYMYACYCVCVCVCVQSHMCMCTCICLPTVYTSVSETISVWWLECYDSTKGKGERTSKHQLKSTK